MLMIMPYLYFIFIKLYTMIIIYQGQGPSYGMRLCLENIMAGVKETFSLAPGQRSDLQHMNDE